MAFRQSVSSSVVLEENNFVKRLADVVVYTRQFGADGKEKPYTAGVPAGKGAATPGAQGRKKVVKGVEDLKKDSGIFNVGHLLSSYVRKCPLG